MTVPYHLAVQDFTIPFRTFQVCLPPNAFDVHKHANVSLGSRRLPNLTSGTKAN